MDTFSKYCIHFSIIGGIVFVGAIILMIIDGGELLQPVMLIMLSFAELLYIFFMSLLYSSMAKPITMSIKVKDRELFLQQVSGISEKKWRRKQIQQNGDDIIYYKFGNKYKDWLTTPVKFEFDGNECHIIIPSYYRESIIALSY